MKLPAAGREYAKWKVTTTDVLTNFQVQLTTGGTWINATYSGGVVSLLVYGPSYTLTDGLGVLVSTDCQPKLRCTDTPELVIRQGSWIYVV